MMPGAQGEPPAVARQRVRRALRAARHATAMSQGDVAEKLSWSLSKMQRIEAGEVGVSLTDLRALLDLYGVTDPGEIGRLTEDARISRRQRWLTSPEHREFLTPALRQLIQFEREASAIRAYQPGLLPGVLQTPAVAETILHWNTGPASERERRVRFDVRMQRHRHIVGTDEAPAYLVILDEAVIKRQIGGAAVMAEQLETLAGIGRRPNVHIRLVPFEKSAMLGLDAPFELLTLGGDDDETVVYRESTVDDRIVFDPAEAHRLRVFFEALWAESLTEDATADRILGEAAALRAALGQSGG